MAENWLPTMLRVQINDIIFGIVPSDSISKLIKNKTSFAADVPTGQKFQELILVDPALENLQNENVSIDGKYNDLPIILTFSTKFPESMIKTNEC